VKFPVKVVVLLLRLPEEFRQEADAIEVGGRRGAGEFREGAHHIAEIAEVCRSLAGGDFARPTDEKRLADAAFINVALDAAQTAARVKKCGVIAAFVVRAVVAAKRTIVFSSSRAF